MIAFLTGTVTDHHDRTLTLDVHGVGFRLFVLPRTLEAFPVGRAATILTYLHVREAALELYGFGTVRERDLFERLLTVSGVGPKMALAVLSAASSEDLEEAIETGNVSLLTNVSGVGLRTAQRIIVDLKDKLAMPRGDGALASIIDALISLGYTPREAQTAAAKTPAQDSVEERIRAALKSMGR